MTAHYTEWGMTAKHDFMRLFLGKYISSGRDRDVYVVANDPDWVVKIERNPTDFQNATEWNIWREVVGTQWEKWFAPCAKISDNGICLIMARTTPLPPEQYPKVLPDFLCDLKPANFGLYKGQVVAHDYGLDTMFLRNALRGGRMKRVSKDDFSTRDR